MCLSAFIDVLLSARIIVCVRDREKERENCVCAGKREGERDNLCVHVHILKLYTHNPYTTHARNTKHVL